MLEGTTTINGTDCYIIKYTNEDAEYLDDKRGTAYIDQTTFGLVKLYTQHYGPEAPYYMERNYVQKNGHYILSSATHKNHRNIKMTTLYTYLSDSKDYGNIDFNRTPFYEQMKKFNKNPNDTFWDNYQHIPLP